MSGGGRRGEVRKRKASQDGDLKSTQVYRHGDVHVVMKHEAIKGLCLDERALSGATTGFQVVSIHQHCPAHFGLFFDAALAAEHAVDCNARAKAADSPERFKVKAWKKLARRRR